MEPVRLKLRADGAVSPRLIEQGIPVSPTDPGAIDSLRLLDEGGLVVPSCIEADGRDEHGRTTWARVTASVEAGGGRGRSLVLEHSPDLDYPSQTIAVQAGGDRIGVATPFYRLELSGDAGIRLSTQRGDLLAGDVSFQLWPDARSIVGAGAGTCRLAPFIGEGWSIEEQSDARCLVVLKGRAHKYAAYTGDPTNIDPNAQFDCELELICCAFSPVVRFRWRIENHTVWQAYLERYTLVVPLAAGSKIEGGERSEDGKFLRYVNAAAPGGRLGMTASFVEALGAGAGINAERRESLCGLDLSQVIDYAGEGMFEPHRYLAAESDDGRGLDLVQGGVNPPHDGNMAAENPEVHRLFYLGMGRTFDGALLVDCDDQAISNELDRVYFELEPDYYSRAGALPEGGDPVHFGEFRDQVFAAADWMLARQWMGTLWWGEWWREYDIYRKQGVESTANGNNPLGPLYHYWRTGDARFVPCAKRAMEFVYDVQLCKRRTGIGPFFHSRRFLIDKMEWIHMRYQRIEGPIKAAHFLGDRRLRSKIIEAMRTHARNLVFPNGCPGFGSNGKRTPAGSDCTNFGEVLGILWRETGEPEFLEMAKKMARWTIRHMDKWDWSKDIGNSYGWHFLMRGMLSTLKATGGKRFREWYLDMARKNMTYPMEQIQFVPWMDWLIVEAEKLSGDTWMLDVLRNNTTALLNARGSGGVVRKPCNCPWSKWPSQWEYIYDNKTIVAYLPVLTARRGALGLPG